MAIRVVNEGTTVTLTASSQEITIPNSDSGNPAHYVMVSTTTSAHILPGQSGSVTASTSSMLVVGEAPVVLHVAGMDAIAVLQAETGGNITIAPIEVT